MLGVLYESYIHPITILSTLPSAGVGALLALMICRIDLSLIALIGIILLIGIVKKNAIMMIDFALDAERDEGLPPEKSIYQACLLRFRPIMMTTMAALLGALPLALENGTGSELRQPLGIAIVGGLLLSQFLTLYTTPVIYLYLDRLGRWVRRWRGASDGRRPAENERRRAADSTVRRHEHFRAIHPPAGRHLAAGDRAVPARHRRLSLPAGGADAARRFPDDLGLARRCRAPIRRRSPPRWPRRWNGGSARSPASRK